MVGEPEVDEARRKRWVGKQAEVEAVLSRLAAEGGALLVRLCGYSWLVCI